MMRMAILSDLHLISPDDPLKEVHANRAHFARAWPSAKQMCRKIQEAAPDLVVSLGDLVDWYSKENRDFALEILDELKTPCLVTPGNHDFEMYPRLADGTIGHFLPAWECEDAATRGWRERGIELGNRLIDAGSTGILLVQSACSTVPPHTREWLTTRGNGSTKRSLNMSAIFSLPTCLWTFRKFATCFRPNTPGET